VNIYWLAENIIPTGTEFLDKSPTVKNVRIQLTPNTAKKASELEEPPTKLRSLSKIEKHIM
jgi:hypothetical protein